MRALERNESDVGRGKSAGDLACQAGLADAAGTDNRDQSRPFEQLADMRKLPFASHERGGVPGDSLQCKVGHP